MDMHWGKDLQTLINGIYRARIQLPDEGESPHSGLKRKRRLRHLRVSWLHMASRAPLGRADRGDD